MDPLEKAIRHHLDSYLSGDMALNAFLDWLVDATWGMETMASPATIRLTHDIELVLAELSSGFLTPDELRADLLEIAGRADAGNAAAVGV